MFRCGFTLSILMICMAGVVVPVRGQIPHVIPPSPEATSVFKFLEVPVSHYTGLPNISIPLHEIRLKQMSIPISLAYHARGIRVEEIAPRVGAGWSLNYGGMISRQVRDLPDDQINGYLFQDYYNEVFTDPEVRGNMSTAMLNHGVDFVPDQFMFQLIGNGGKFVINQIDGQVLQQEFSDIRIEYEVEDVRIKRWVVTDEAGNTYYFGRSKDGTREAFDYDEVVNNYAYSSLHGMANLGNDGDARTINTWHLIEIETPFSERVEFFYEDEASLTIRRSHDKLERPDVVAYFTHVWRHQQQVKEIVYPGGRVSFVPATAEREDLTGSYALDGVKVFDAGDQLLKEFQFFYQYRESADDDNQLHYLKMLEAAAAKRLFLDSLREKAGSGETLPPYTFQYNATPLPNRFSNSQDVWGYYNGAPNGHYLTFFQYGNHPVSRAVDVTLSEAGLLKKITYPSGGEVAFTYEHNVGCPPSFMDSLLYPLTIHIETVPRLEGFLMHPDYYRPELGIYTDTIHVGGGVVGNAALFTMNLPPFCDIGDFDNADPHCRYTVTLERDSNSIPLHETSDSSGSRVIPIEPGQYLLKVVPAYGHDPTNLDSAFYMALEWEETTMVAELMAEDQSMYVGGRPLMYAGGKRIKSIDYRQGDSVVLSRRYEYVNPEGESSGVLFGLPNFHYKSAMVGYIPMVNIHGSVPGSPLTNVQGNNVGYSRVVEYYHGGDERGGKTEYEFTTPQDGGEYYKFPYHIPIDAEWLRGKVLRTTYFSEEESGEYTPVKSIEHEYLYFGEVDYPIILKQPHDLTYSITRTKFYLPLLVFVRETNSEDAYKPYYIIGGTVNPNYVKETYYHQGNPAFTRQTNYTYDHNSHYQTQTVENLCSDGSKEVTFTAYPSDYPVGTPFIDSMKLKNLLSYPIEVVNYREKGSSIDILSGTVFQYKTTAPALKERVFNLESENPLPLASFRFSNRFVNTLPPAGPPSSFAPHDLYKPQMNFGAYDHNGNILQVNMEGDISIAYLWDYNNLYPVAEARNAHHADIAYTSFEADGKGSWNFSGTPTTDATSPTGKRAYALASGPIGRTGLQAEVVYRLMYWAKSSNSPLVTGSAGSQVSAPMSLSTRNGWTLFERTITNTTQVSISGSQLIDELRLHPLHAQMRTYTYETQRGMSSATDENGVTTYFSYDGFNRFHHATDHRGNLLKRHDYVYGRE